jgi:dihydrofolate reductase
MPRKLVYFVACTVDGFIARADGSFDWALFLTEHKVYANGFVFAHYHCSAQKSLAAM